MMSLILATFASLSVASIGTLVKPNSMIASMQLNVHGYIP